jgi:two-component system chemotaxis response regulator CheY
MEAEDGVAALEKMNNNDVKLIFLDYNMPRMNGIEFMKKVRSDPRFKTVPIIMLTTESEEEKMTDGYMTGAHVYLTKPFQAEALTKVVDAIRFWHIK